MFSRRSPSPRYQELLRQNRQLHLEGNPAQKVSAADSFPGKSLFRQLPRIKNLVARTNSSSLLDYGCGKGLQYQASRIVIDGKAIKESVQDYLDVDYIYRYDGAYPPFTKLPEDRFDGVICTDVLEHCPEQDMDWIVDELFGYAKKFVFASVAGYPAGKMLPNGENAHCTQMDSVWWKSLFSAVGQRFPQVTWEVWYVSRLGAEADPEYLEVRLGLQQNP